MKNALKKANDYTKELDDLKIFLIKNFESGEWVISTKNGIFSGGNEKMKNCKNYSDNIFLLLSLLEELYLDNLLLRAETIGTEYIKPANFSPHGFSGIVKVIEEKMAYSQGGIEYKYSIAYKLFLELKKETNTIFFAREFGNDLTLDFYKKFKDSLKKNLKMDSIMLEEDLKGEMIHDRIKNEIKLCKYFLADLTSLNSCNLKVCSKHNEKYCINLNVMWELGYAAALGKPILCLIHKDMLMGEELNYAKLTFDISTYSTIVYSSNEDENKEAIKKIINAIKVSLLAN